MKSKSVWLISTYPPGYGGVSVHTLNLVESLSSNGVKVNLIRINGPILTIFSGLFKLLTKFKSSDAVHIHTSFFSIFIIIILQLIFLRRIFWTFRLFISIHEGDLENRIRKNSRVRNYIINQVINRVDNLVLMSNTQSDNLKKHFNLKCRTIVISPMILDDKLSINHRRVLNSNHLKLLVVAQLSELYGILELIEGVNALVKSRPYISMDLSLVFGSKNSDEKYRGKIIKAIQSADDRVKISFNEDLNAKEMSEVYRDSDIFIRNTKVDSYGLSVSEALVNGLFCLATDVCERPEGVWIYPLNGFAKSFSEFIDSHWMKNTVNDKSKIKFKSSGFFDYYNLYFS